jgi:flagellar motor protein MotB
MAEERDELREDKERLEEASAGAEKARVQALGQAEDLREERDRLAQDVKKLTKRVAELESALQDHERAREAVVSRTTASQARWGPLRAELDPELRAGQVVLSDQADGLQVVLVEEALFAPGSGELSAGGRALLQRLALRVRDDDQRVEVEGDGDAPALRLARGASVMRALAAGGVPNEQLRAGSFRDDEAAEVDAVPARRGAEIRLLPNLGAGPGAGGVAAPSPTPGP